MITQLIFSLTHIKAFKHDPKTEGAGGTGFKQLRSTGAAFRAAEALPKQTAQDSQAANLR